MEVKMNIVLWILQILVGLAFVMAGYTHAFNPEPLKAQPGGQWITAVPDGLRLFIGICEILGGVGVILPAVTGILPWLTPLAAALLGLMMLLAAGFHVMRREYPNIAFNLVLFALAAFVAYGRFVLVPF
jgi:putative oxidoreductase